MSFTRLDFFSLNKMPNPAFRVTGGVTKNGCFCPLLIYCCTNSPSLPRALNWLAIRRCTSSVNRAGT